MRSLQFWISGLMIVLWSSAVFAQGFGSLTGQFVYDGTPPAPAKITPDKDPAVCAKDPLFDEELVVGKDGSIENVVVSYYLKPGPTSKAPAADPAVLAKLPPTVRCDNEKCRFTPHITTLVIGKQQLILGNKDPIAHNVKGDCLRNSPFNPLLPAGGDLPQKGLDKPESLPVPLTCSIHPWMRGRLVVTEHPFVAVTDASGKFTISGIPAGTHTFRAWQEKSGYVVDVKEGGSAKKWMQGRFDVTIKAGAATDLGKILVAPTNFMK